MIAQDRHQRDKAANFVALHMAPGADLEDGFFAQLAGAGVKRISLGSTLARAALGGIARAAREIRDRGTFDFAADAMPFAEANALMKPRVVVDRSAAFGVNSRS